jgi:hypothetical protein
VKTLDEFYEDLQVYTRITLGIHDLEIKVESPFRATFTKDNWILYAHVHYYDSKLATFFFPSLPLQFLSVGKDNFMIYYILTGMYSREKVSNDNHMEQS